LDSFEERTSYLLDIASKAEQLNREALFLMIDRLVYKRNDSGEGGMELLKNVVSIAQKLKDPHSRVATKPLESPEGNRRRFEEAYKWVAATIEKMEANEMFRLIARLKTRKKLLIDILKSIPRSKECVIVRRDGTSLRYSESPPSRTYVELPDEKGESNESSC